MEVGEEERNDSRDWRRHRRRLSIADPSCDEKPGDGGEQVACFARDEIPGSSGLKVPGIEGV